MPSAFYQYLIDAANQPPPIPPAYETREEWLSAFMEAMRVPFAQAGHPLPERLRVSCGFAHGSRRAIGQAWYPQCSTDNTAELFISPVLDNPPRVADVSLHEGVHAALPPGAGHKKPFKRLAVKLGLTGKMTATVATPELTFALEKFLPVHLGAYPHSELNTMFNMRKKQGTRLIKLACQCGMVIRTTRQWLVEVGAPLCACGGAFVLAD